MSRYTSIVLSAAVILLTAFSVVAKAENAVRYTNAIVQPGGSFVIDMVIQNDIVISGALIPFRWSSPDITLESISIIRDRFQGTIVDTTLQPDPVERTGGVLLVSGIGIFDRGWINPGSGVIAQLRFRVSLLATDQIAYIDSVNSGGGRGITQYSDFSGLEVLFPAVYRGVVQIGNAGGESRLEVRPESLEFLATTAGDNPTPRTMTIAGEGPFTLNWQAEWQAEWLSMSETSGITSSFPTASVNPDGLPGGLYRDTIVVTSAEAANSPVRVPVELIVTQPDVEVFPQDISIAGYITPPSVTSTSFIVNSTGSGELEWSAFWSESWLQMTPDFGQTPSVVTVTADLTGLDEGVYEDEILIVAPGSANSPQLVNIVFVLDSLNRAGMPRVRLGQNIPNPFDIFGDSETRIKYFVEDPVPVDLAVYDLLGRRVRTLVSGQRDGGDHEVAWDGLDNAGELVSSGHYFYRIMTPLGDATRRVVLIK